MKKELAAYVERGNRQVDGWLSQIAMDVLVDLAGMQMECGIRGPVCEIGIHHGKLFILLHLLTEAGETSVAWDLFEHQEENLDQSGRGDKEIFQENLRYHDCDVGRIRIVSENSMRLTPAAVMRECEGRPRLFSIDGGHTAEITRNDIFLAQNSLCEGGLIILDDVFNEAWPGVAEGTCRYFMSEKEKLFPVAILGNKFFLTNTRAMSASYIRRLQKPWKGFHLKKSTVFDGEVLVMTPVRRSIRRYLADTPVWRAIQDKPAGKLIKNLVVRGRVM